MRRVSVFDEHLIKYIISGVFSMRGTPVPISNTAVKPHSADDSALRESRSVPDIMYLMRCFFVGDFLIDNKVFARYVVYVLCWLTF